MMVLMLSERSPTQAQERGSIVSAANGLLRLHKRPVIQLAQPTLGNITARVFK
jgi:hypothetical protein